MTRKSDFAKESKAAAALFKKLGLQIEGLDQSKILYPVVEECGPRKAQIYIKFMSDNGVLDEELGNRFAKLCEDRKVRWSSTRPRSGTVRAKDFPVLAKMLK